MTGNPYSYPGSLITGAPFPGMLPVSPLGPSVVLPTGTFSDAQVFWAGADFGNWMQALGLSISTPITVTAYVIQGTDPEANTRWTGAAATVNALPPPYGTGQVNGGVRRQWGPGVAGVVYGFTATAQLSDGTVLSQGSQGTCVAAQGGAEETILSAAYDSGTGAVTLTMASDLDLAVGDTFTVSGAAGTGSYADINGTFTAITGTGSATVVYMIATGLTLTITGGNVSY